MEERRIKKKRVRVWRRKKKKKGKRKKCRVWRIKKRGEKKGKKKKEMLSQYFHNSFTINFKG